MPATLTARAVPRRPSGPPIEELDLDGWIDEVLNQHAAVGFAMGVVRDGRLAYFGARGLANIETKTPQMAVPLALGVTDPFERLARIAAATAERKTRDRSSVGKLLRSSIGSRVALMAVDRQRVNVCSANIPGPRRPLFLLGSRVLEVVPILPLIGRVSLGVGAISYAGAFTIGVAADREKFADLDVFLTGMERELQALDRSTARARPATGPVIDYVVSDISADNGATRSPPAAATASGRPGATPA